MDLTKWKTIAVQRHMYEELKKLAEEEGRTISGQLRLIFDWYMMTEKPQTHETFDRGFARWATFLPRRRGKPDKDA